MDSATHPLGILVVVNFTDSLLIAPPLGFEVATRLLVIQSAAGTAERPKKELER